MAVAAGLILAGLSILSPAATAQTTATPGVCYASTGNADGGRLLTIDLSTGAGTLIGPAVGLGARPALAINSSGEIFVMDEGNFGTLHRIDATTGAQTFVGTESVFGGFTLGMAFDENDVLYGGSWNFGSFYTIDTATGAQTLIGPDGLALVGMAIDPSDGTVYASTAGCCSGSDPPDLIYTINKSTGVVTTLGFTGLGGATPDLAFDAAGNLYGLKGGGQGVNNLISIDKSTGAGTVIGPIGFSSVSGMDCFGDVTTLACTGFEPPMASGPVKVKGKRALPLKAELFDADGIVITDLDLTAQPVVQVLFDSGGGMAVDVTADALPVGLGDEGNQFVYTAARWQYNLKTLDYTAPGTYTVFMASGDDAEYGINPTCEASFVIE